MDKLVVIVLTLACLAVSFACASPPAGESVSEAPEAAQSGGGGGGSATEARFREIAQPLIARRDSAMSTLVQLEGDESKLFWSIKKDYDAELRGVYGERIALIDEFSEVHDKLDGEIAGELASRVLALDRRRTDLHETYFTRMAEEVSPVAAVQWLQLQTQFEAMADVKISEGVPLAIR